MNNNGIDITKAYHNGIEITAIMHNGVDVGAFTPPTPDYQTWENYPDSPVLTEDYPYQVVFDYAGSKKLWVTTEPFSLYSANELRIKTFGATPNIYYTLNAGVWLLIGAYNVQTFTTLEETNNDIYTDATLSAVYFAKTTA